MKHKTIHKTIIICLAAILLSCNNDTDNASPNITTSTQGVIENVKTFGGSKNESGQAVKKTTDGGYIVLGFTQSTDGDVTTKLDNSYDVWVVKYNQDNQLQWSQTYGGSGDERGNDIIQTNDGGYAIIGFTYSNDGDITNNNGQEDFWIIKIDAQGNLIWQKTYGFSGIDTGYSIIQTSDNGFFVTGVLDVTASNGAGNTRNNQTLHAGGDYWAVKLDQSGTLEWSKYFGGFFSDTAYDVIQTTDQGFIIVGSSDSADTDISNNKGSYDYWVVKISSSGNLEWEKNFGGDEIDEARAIIPSGDGNYLIIGDTRSEDIDVSTNFGAADVWLIKISPQGELLWEKTYGGEDFDVGRAISSTQDNGFVICGSSRSLTGNLTNNKGQNDGWVLKIDANGSLKWQQSIGGSNIDFLYGITQLNNGTIISVGESSSNDFDITENKGFTDLLLIEIK
ncbi:hypothetical protein V6251_14580 [Olleya sp. Ti.3.14]|uniref:hypothetical protein n=1 Tax=Olleya sp. Ti.3.14 TaxID=3121297 RepID=UPI00311E908B